MPRKTPVIKEEEKGEYTIHHCEDGTYRIFGPKLKSGGEYLPSPSKFLAKYQKESAQGNTTRSTKTYLQLYGIVASGTSSVIAGKKHFEIPLGKPRIPLEQIQQTIRDYWTVEEIEEAKKERKSTRQTVRNFQEAYPAEYRECFRRYRGFKKVLETMEPPYHTAHLFLTRRKAKKNHISRKIRKAII